MIYEFEKDSRKLKAFLKNLIYIRSSVSKEYIDGIEYENIYQHKNNKKLFSVYMYKGADTKSKPIFEFYHQNFDISKPLVVQFREQVN